MWKRIKPEDTERENGVLIQLAGTRIGRRSYAIGRCYVAGRPAIAVKSGRARTTLVRIGHRNAQLAEVLSGLSAGDRVVLHPSDRVKEGASVAQRQTR